MQIFISICSAVFFVLNDFRWEVSCLLIVDIGGIFYHQSMFLSFQNNYIMPSKNLEFPQFFTPNVLFTVKSDMLVSCWGPLDANPNDSSGQVCFKLAKWFQRRKSSIGWICIFDQKKVQITKIMEKHLIYKQLITLQISTHFRLKIVAFLSISKHFYFS